MPRKDLWQELTREEKRILRRDLAEHFRLRLDANEAVLRYLRERLGRDPTMQEVGETRDSLMHKLEPEVRREVYERRGWIAPQDRVSRQDSASSEYADPGANPERRSETPPRSDPCESEEHESRRHSRPELRLILGGKYRERNNEGRV